MEKAELANFPPTVRAFVAQFELLHGLDLEILRLACGKEFGITNPMELKHLEHGDFWRIKELLPKAKQKKFIDAVDAIPDFSPIPAAEYRKKETKKFPPKMSSWVRSFELGTFNNDVVLLKLLCGPEYGITDPEEIGELDEEERRQCIDLMPKGKRYVLKSALDAICAPPADPEADQEEEKEDEKEDDERKPAKQESSSIKNAAWGGSTSEADQDDEGKAEEKPQGKKGNALWGKLKKRASVITRLTPKKNKGEDEAAEEEKEEPNSPTEEDTEELKKQAFNERLTAYYSEKNPDKVAEVPKMVNKFFGREDSLFKVLVKKYGESSREDGVTPGGRAVPIDARMVRPVGAKSDKELKDEEMKKAAAEEDRKARAGFGQAKKPGSALGAQSEQGSETGKADAADMVKEVIAPIHVDMNTSYLEGGHDAFDSDLPVASKQGEGISLRELAEGEYRVTFTKEKLGITLGDHRPPSIDANSMNVPNLTVGDFLIEVNSEDVTKSHDPYHVALGLIKKSGRPLILTLKKRSHHDVDVESDSDNESKHAAHVEKQQEVWEGDSDEDDWDADAHWGSQDTKGKPGTGASPWTDDGDDDDILVASEVGVNQTLTQDAPRVDATDSFHDPYADTAEELPDDVWNRVDSLETKSTEESAIANKPDESSTIQSGGFADLSDPFAQMDNGPSDSFWTEEVKASELEEVKAPELEEAKAPELATSPALATEETVDKASLAPSTEMTDTPIPTPTPTPLPPQPAAGLASFFGWSQPAPSTELPKSEETIETPAVEESVLPSAEPTPPAESVLTSSEPPEPFKPPIPEEPVPSPTSSLEPAQPIPQMSVGNVSSALMTAPGAADEEPAPSSPTSPSSRLSTTAIRRARRLSAIIAADSPAVEEVERPQMTHRDRLLAFYAEKNPSGIRDVDERLKAYAGREEELFHMLVRKYGPSESELAYLRTKGGSAKAFPVRVSTVSSPGTPKLKIGDSVAATAGEVQAPVAPPPVAKSNAQSDGTVDFFGFMSSIESGLSSVGSVFNQPAEGELVHSTLNRATIR
jgi:hypothetical protein